MAVKKQELSGPCVSFAIHLDAGLKCMLSGARLKGDLIDHCAGWRAKLKVPPICCVQDTEILHAGAGSPGNSRHRLWQCSFDKGNPISHVNQEDHARDSTHGVGILAVLGLVL